MKRVQEGGEWTLFCPSQCHDLIDSYGKEFEALYESYEKIHPLTQRNFRHVKFETYSGFTDRNWNTLHALGCISFKSNHKHLGTMQTRTFARKLCSFLPRMRLQFVIWRPLHFPNLQHSQAMVITRLTLRSMRWSEPSQTTWIGDRPNKVRSSRTPYIQFEA